MARGLRRTLADDWSSEVTSGFALAGFLAVVLALFTLLAMGPLVRIDAYFNLSPPPAGWVPVLHVLDRVGQRAICLPLLALVLWRCYRRGSGWRPFVVAGASVFMLNLIVLVLKVGLGRGQPVSADPSFFVGGMAYPSGHTANIVLVYGLMVILLRRYGGASRRLSAWLLAIVAGLSLMMVVVSLTLNWHWFADLLAGLLIGGIVLELTVTLDRQLRAWDADVWLRAHLPWFVRGTDRLGAWWSRWSRPQGAAPPSTGGATGAGQPRRNPQARRARRARRARQARQARQDRRARQAQAAPEQTLGAPPARRPRTADAPAGTSGPSGDRQAS